MKDNFFNSMFMEGGKVSHKRWISVTAAAVLLWCIVYAVLKASDPASQYKVITATMVFILIMSGVATVAQIVSIVKGTPAPKEDENKPQ